jgi:GNAT superfamily N-acetyltransferase
VIGAALACSLLGLLAALEPSWSKINAGQPLTGLCRLSGFRIEYLDEHQGAIPELASLHHAEWFAVTPHLTVADRIAGFTGRARRGSIPTGFVGLIGERVVGMACLVVCDIESHCHFTPWLATVLVARPYRGHGIGSALSERATQEARRLGIPTIYLFTFDKQGFYARLGWAALEDARYGGRLGSIMVRQLAA